MLHIQRAHELIKIVSDHYLLRIQVLQKTVALREYPMTNLLIPFDVALRSRCPIYLQHHDCYGGVLTYGLTPHEPSVIFFHFEQKCFRCNWPRHEIIYELVGMCLIIGEKAKSAVKLLAYASLAKLDKSTSVSFRKNFAELVVERLANKNQRAL